MSDWRSSLDEVERALPRDPVGWYKKYGVTFRDVYREDLDTLRQWRNHPEIRRFMVFRGEITSEMQQHWFESIDFARERYSILLFRDEPVGLTQLRHIDAQTRSAEGGITIWRPEHQNSLLSYRISIAGMDWDFLELGFEQLDVTVLKSNARARRFVRSLGYRLHDPNPEGEVLRGSVDAATYFATVKTWRTIVHEEMRKIGEPFPVGA